jgi:hypothetical protein
MRHINVWLVQYIVKLEFVRLRSAVAFESQLGVLIVGSGQVDAARSRILSRSDGVANKHAGRNHGNRNQKRVRISFNTSDFSNVTHLCLYDSLGPNSDSLKNLACLRGVDNPFTPRRPRNVFGEAVHVPPVQHEVEYCRDIHPRFQRQEFARR